MHATQGVFRALADPTRRDILMYLSQEELTIAEVSERFDITRGAVKKHLTILQEGELISVHKRGRESVNRLEPDALRTATDWLNYFSQFWDNKLHDLSHAIDQHQQGNKS